jgi:copper chaperone
MSDFLFPNPSSIIGVIFNCKPLSTITQAVQTVDANAIVQADPQTKSVSVETKASETAIKEAIAKVGYPPS